MDPLYTTLLEYCETSDLDGIKECAYKGVDIRAYDEMALHWAAGKGHLDVVQYLISLGADIHIYNESVLQDAYIGGHLNVVQLLISKGAIIEPFNHGIINYVHKNGILINNTGIDILQCEYDKIKFIKNGLLKSIPIKQSIILLNVDSFVVSF